MRTFLGLPLTRQPLSDEQYIEKLRKSHSRTRRFAWFMVALAVFQVVLLTVFFVLINRYAELLRSLADDPEDSDLATMVLYAAVAVGVGLGFTASGIFAGVIACVRLAYRLFTGRHDRSGRLAIEYYDLSLKLIDEDLSSRESTNA